ncbi:glucose 1-dehydrogenase [Azospirillum soli]|uniref:glucose 1-dehydrogenase n=1 Tax=Azospirillum soli TaxID=1304799 RepID=UPI001AE58682|nr:glucose 1-dehydrogenase [Azospirillum soli]MBP2316589.1 NAD(P)-dependent dehydrogenase (short-subunit alcohol dehydrogenase family) [Azospirillum soli]
MVRQQHERHGDRVALVTGAGSGIGRATALAFARSGARVVVADIARPSGEETVSLIAGEGGSAVFVPVDVADAASVEAMVAAAVAHYGRIDCAFNNAGILPVKARTAECSEDDWDRTIAVNLKGVWLCMKHEIRQMLAQGGGAIVNASSVAGLKGYALTSPYVASKHAIVGLTRTAAIEYGPDNIRVNAVCPGAVMTDLVRGLGTSVQSLEGRPMARYAEPEEIAAAVLWLCSDEASFVTGSALPIDGGLSAQ